MEEKQQLEEESTTASRAAGSNRFTVDSSGSLSFPSVTEQVAAELEYQLGTWLKEPVLWEPIHKFP